MQLHYKFFRLFLISLIVLFCTSNIHSQEPPGPLPNPVLVTIQQPPLNKLSITDLWKITLNNVSNDVMNVYLYGTLEEQNAGLIATAKSSSINLPPGVKIITINEIEPITVNYPNPDPKYKEILIRSGSLPGGDYEICVYVRYTGTNYNCGSNCIQQNIEIIPAPTLISPSEGETVINKRPMFTWMQALRPGIDVRYKIKVVEVRDNQTPEIAMQTNPAWFEEDNITTRVFQYPTSAQELIEESKYAWQITSLDFFGNPIGENNGKSEVWSINIDSQLSETPLSLELISPQDGEEINTPNPEFKWSSIGKPETTYTLKIWLLSDFINKRLSESNLFQSELGIEIPFFMLGKDNLFLEKVGIDRTCFIFTGKSLIPGFGYLWQVDAVSREGLVYTSSPVFYFQAGLGAGQSILLKDVSPTTQVEETECEGAKLKKVVLEWHDTIKDDDIPVKEVLADITNKITIEVSAAPECKIKVDKVHTKNKCVETDTICYYPAVPIKTDNNPQTDDDYRSMTMIYHSGNCICIINVAIYMDLPTFSKITENDKQLQLLGWYLILTNCGAHMAADFPTLKLMLAKNKDLNREELEKAHKEREKKFGKGMKGGKKLLDTYEKAFTKALTLKECPEFLKTMNKFDIGYIVSVYKICVEYKPCKTCKLEIESITSSHLGDSDHFIQRIYKFNGKSKTYTDKGDDY